jgi:F-type H+-transporting ATPase subunit b
VVSLDYSLGIQIVNFLLLIWILNRLLFRPLLGMIDRRKQRFAEAEAEIKHLEELVAQKMADYEEKLRQTKAEALERKTETLRDASEEAKAILDSARSEIPGLMEQFHVRMQGEIEAAKRTLGHQSQRLSIEIAEKVLGRRLQ